MNSSKLYNKDISLLYIIFIFEILVYFRKENNTKLNKLIAFIKLESKLILKKKVIL